MRLLIFLIRTSFLFYFSIIFAFCSQLRCHCNLPSCNETNSMCKSNLGCFQELTTHNHHNKRELRHGCLELWPLKRPYQCAVDIAGGGDEIIVQKLYSEKTTITNSNHVNRRRHNTVPLRCCLDDMCNFANVKQQRVNEFHTLRLNVVAVSNKKIASVDNEGVTIEKTPNATTLLNARNPWFTAALIVVPVFGMFVLIMLIFFACYLLKNDSTIKQQQHQRHVCKGNYYDSVVGSDDFDIIVERDFFVTLNNDRRVNSAVDVALCSTTNNNTTSLQRSL